MSMIRLTGGERKRLQIRLRKTHDARVYRRTLAVLQVDRGLPVKAVADLLGVSPRSVWRWLESYALARKGQDLADPPGRGRPDLWDAEDWAVLEELIGDNPQDWGYAASQWTVPLLQGHLERGGLPPCCADTLRHHLHELGLVWKRPRYVLQPDPEAEKKTRHPKQAHGPAAPQRRSV